MLVKWDVNARDGTLISRIPEQIYCLAFNTKNKLCAVGTRAGSIYEIDTESLLLRRQWIAHSGAIFDLHYSEEELLSCGEDGRLKRWKPGETTPDRILELSTKSLRCLAIEEEKILVSGSEGVVWQLDGDIFSVLSHFQASSTSVFALAVNEDILFTAGRDAHLHAWKGEKEEHDIAAHWYTIHALSLSPDGKYLATGSMDKSVKIWDAQSLELLKVIDRERYEAHSSSVNRIVWLDTRRFLTCSDDRMIYCFEIS